jgi:hypothetical protein
MTAPSLAEAIAARIEETAEEAAARQANNPIRLALAARATGALDDHLYAVQANPELQHLLSEVDRATLATRARCLINRQVAEARQ